MYRTGLLVVTNVGKFAEMLAAVTEYVTETLYIELHIGRILKPASRYCSLVYDIYATALKLHTQLDVVVIVGNLKNGSRATPYVTSKPVDVLIFEKRISSDETKQFMDRYQTENVVELSIKPDKDGHPDDFQKIPAHPNTSDAIEVGTAVCGGTFDRLHGGHKDLLTEAVLHAKKRVCVGVTNSNLHEKKLLRELMQPADIRVNRVRNFLRDIDNSLTYDVEILYELIGSIRTDPDLDLLVVSEETVSGGEPINAVRRAHNLRELKIHDTRKERLFSSTQQRINLLGTRLKEPEPNPHLPNYPYIIGLTGYIMSGKSMISQYFAEHGAAVINCDKLEHDVYEPGKECHAKIVAHFGNGILSDGHRIDRNKLEAIVFADGEKLAELHQIIWPEMIAEMNRQIEKIRIEKTHDIVMIESEIFMQTTNLKQIMHELWSMILPVEEVLRRLIKRNGLTEEQAKQRVNTQTSNEDLVEKSNVVFSAIRSYEFTRQQAEKAWNGLQEHLSKLKT